MDSSSVLGPLWHLARDLHALVQRQAELWPRTGRPGGPAHSGECLQCLARWIEGGATEAL